MKLEVVKIEKHIRPKTLIEIVFPTLTNCEEIPKYFALESPGYT